MTVGDLLGRIDSRELSEWMAYDRINTPESWHQNAQVCHTLYALWTKKPPPFDSFLPKKTKARADPITPDEIRARLAPFRANPKR